MAIGGLTMHYMQDRTAGELAPRIWVVVWLSTICWGLVIIGAAAVNSLLQ